MNDPSSPNLAEARDALSRQQAALLRAMHGSGPIPDGFDAGQLRVTGESLSRKRMRTVQKIYAVTAAALGERFGTEFASFVSEHPTPAEDPGADGLQFMRWLRARRKLPAEGRIELACGEVAAGGIPRLVSDGWRGVVIVFRWRRSTRIVRLGLRARTS